MRATDFVASYFNAWNHQDPEAIAHHLAAEGVYCDVPRNVQIRRDELFASFSDFFAKHRHRYELIGEILVGVDAIAFQYRTHVVGGSSGESAESFRGAEFMTLHGDAAMTITDYYDIPGRARNEDAAGLAGHGAKPKYAKSGLSVVQLSAYKQRLEQIMASQRLYLRSDLTLPKLARVVDCSVNHLSQVINSGFGMSFFEYLNHQRIQHAKVLLSGHDAMIVDDGVLPGGPPSTLVEVDAGAVRVLRAGRISAAELQRVASGLVKGGEGFSAASVEIPVEESS